jgi:alkylation response protein AidB-like acyl-CoA dehydrogenase
MDLSIDESQQILVDTFSEMLEKECPTTHVRDCEGTGYSPDLWNRYSELGANVMGLPESADGLEMSLLDLGLVATRSGHALAPVPFLEVATAGRLLARLDPADALLGGIVEGKPSVSICLPRPHAALGTSRSSGGCCVVPFGAIAEHVVAYCRDGDALCVVSNPEARRSNRVKDLGDGALANWDLSSSGSDVRILARGDAARREIARANSEWKLLAGFWLVGIAQRALAIGAEYARERIQFGVPIGGFQAIAHPLSECAIRTDGAELLAWEAAWADTEDALRFEMLASMAFSWASQTAIRTADISLHTHGGYGFSTEYDIQLYYRRARALSSIGGGSKEELQAVAMACFDPDGTGTADSLLGGA